MNICIYIYIHILIYSLVKSCSIPVLVALNPTKSYYIPMVCCSNPTIHSVGHPVQIPVGHSWIPWKKTLRIRTCHGFRRLVYAHVLLRQLRLSRSCWGHQRPGMPLRSRTAMYLGGAAQVMDHQDLETIHPLYWGTWPFFDFQIVFQMEVIHHFPSVCLNYQRARGYGRSLQSS